MADLDELRRALARIEELEVALAESRAAIDELCQAKDWLETLLENAPDSIIVTTPDGVIRYSNRAAAGNRLEDVVGASAFRYLAPDTVARARQAFETVTATGKPQLFDATTVFGSIWETRVVRIPSTGTSSPTIMAIGSEITERKRAQEAFRWSEERGRIAAQAARMGLWSWEPGETSIAFDASSAAMLGWPGGAKRADVEACMAAIHADDHERVRAAAYAFFAGRDLTDVEVRGVGPAGTTRWLLLSGKRAIRESTGSEVLIGSLFDITERRLLEEQLRQAQKMEAIGKLTAGIAHNFNNLLAVIIPGIKLATQRPLDREALMRDVEYAAVRAAELVRELMHFARHGKLAKPSAVDVRDLAKRVTSMLRATLDRAIAIELVDAATEARVEGDAGQLEQVLLNICLNARDALGMLSEMQGDAKLRLRIELDVVAGDALYPARSSIRIRIVDNGPGMPEDVRARVFEPFFTTKGPGRGTGLGLATAYAIVQDHAGKLFCESTVGVGTTFTVLLPALT